MTTEMIINQLNFNTTNSISTIRTLLYKNCYTLQFVQKLLKFNLIILLQINKEEINYNLTRNAPPIGTLKMQNPFDFGSNSSTAIFAPINFELS